MALTCAIGLMSGTSMDGIDVAAMFTDGGSVVERGPGAFYAYDAAFSRRIEAALEVAKQIGDRHERPGGLDALERDITSRHTEAVKQFLRNAPEHYRNPDVLGFHGQTVLHRPEQALTVQLGDGQLLAKTTGIGVVHDMRANDMVQGGQGAPLVPVYHAALTGALPDHLRRYPVAFINIGGISNVTYVAKHGDPIAFDCGPGNALIDQWVSAHAGVPLDQNGKIASEGGVVERVVDAYLENPYFERAAPKSLDRGDFTLEQAEGLELADGARTLAAVSAKSIFEASKYMPEMPKLWMLCGGGRKNPHIRGDLSELVEPSGGEVIVAEDANLDGDTTEAEAWAYLAVRSLKGLPLTFPTTTGCAKPVSGGTISNR